MSRPRICLLGVPWDLSSSFVRGAAAAPRRIREALWSPSTNTATELGISIEPDTFDDRGDLPLEVADAPACRAAIEDAIAAVLRDGGTPVVLGGDHSVSYPILRAFRHQPPATILHVDAHGDLYDEFPAHAPAFAPALAPDGATARLRPADPAFTPGSARARLHQTGTGAASEDVPAATPMVEVPGLPDRYSHASPFARIMEEGLAGRLVQVGIRTATPHLRAQALKFGVEVHGPHHPEEAPVEALRGPVYVSLDLDGLDPAYAPGVSHPEPGGLSTRDVVRLLHRIRAPIAGADLVEYNPALDTRDLTARVAAKLLKELLAVALRNART